MSKQCPDGICLKHTHTLRLLKISRASTFSEQRHLLKKAVETDRDLDKTVQTLVVITKIWTIHPTFGLNFHRS